MGIFGYILSGLQAQGRNQAAQNKRYAQRQAKTGHYIRVRDIAVGSKNKFTPADSNGQRECARRIRQRDKILDRYFDPRLAQ